MQNDYSELVAFIYDQEPELLALHLHNMKLSAIKLSRNRTTEILSMFNALPPYPAMFSHAQLTKTLLRVIEKNWRDANTRQAIDMLVNPTTQADRGDRIVRRDGSRYEADSL